MKPILIGISSLKSRALKIFSFKLLCALLVASFFISGPLRGQTDPSLKWHTIQTKYFKFYYIPSDEAWAFHLSKIADGIYEKLNKQYKHNYFSKDKLRVLLNPGSSGIGGSYSLVPAPHVVLDTLTWAVSPSITLHLADEIRLVFTHELIHAISIVPVEGFFSFVTIFNNRLSFGWFLPSTFVEGVATWEESQDGDGRVSDPFYEDQVVLDLNRKKLSKNKNVPLFTLAESTYGKKRKPPGRGRVYYHGAYFIKHLGDKYGTKKVRDFFNGTKGYVPFYYPILFSKIFGSSLEKEWATYQRKMVTAKDNQITKNPKGFSAITKTGGSKYSTDFYGDRFYFYDNNLHDIPTIRSVSVNNPNDRRVVEGNIGGVAAFDANDGVIAYLVDRRSTYKNEQYLVARNIKNNGVYFSKEMPGLMAISVYKKNTFYLTQRDTGGSRVMLYDIKTRTASLFVGNKSTVDANKKPVFEEKVYGSIDANDKYLAVNVRYRNKSQSTIEVYNHSGKKVTTIDFFQRAFHPKWHKNTATLYFSAIKNSKDTYKVYAYNVNSKKLQVLNNGGDGPNKHWFRPAPVVSDGSGSSDVAKSIYVVTYNAEGNDIAKIDSAVWENASGLKSSYKASLLTTANILGKPLDFKGEKKRYNSLENFNWGLNYIALGTDKIGYAFSLTDTPLHWLTLSLEFGGRYNTLQPYWNFSYNSKGLKYQSWKLKWERDSYARQTTTQNNVNINNEMVAVTTPVVSFNRFGLNQSLNWSYQSWNWGIASGLGYRYLLQDGFVNNDAQLSIASSSTFAWIQSLYWAYSEPALLDIIPPGFAWRTSYALLGNKDNFSRYEPLVSQNIKQSTRLTPTTFLQFRGIYTTFLGGTENAITGAGPKQSLTDSIAIPTEFPSLFAHRNDENFSAQSVWMGEVKIAQYLFAIDNGYIFYIPAFFFQDVSLYVANQWIGYGFTESGLNQEQYWRSLRTQIEVTFQAQLNVAVLYNIAPKISYYYDPIGGKSHYSIFALLTGSL